MAGVVFQDDFEVAQINPEGAKFEKVNRLVCKGVVYEIEFLIDVNSELFECEEGDKLTLGGTWVGSGVGSGGTSSTEQPDDTEPGPDS